MLALVLARLEQWSSPVIMLTVALGVVGGAARLDHDYGTGSPWCSVAERMDAMASPGDRMVFGSSTYASPVLACLGDDGTTLLSSGPTVPALTSTDLRDPRALWMNRVASVDDVLALAPGETAHYVWVPAIDAAVGGAVGELRDAGATCEFESFGAVTLASCTTG